ncbi:ATP-binding protein [Deinococcus cellulosilyticus]|uniref:AAA+ ATPase domain-containing protein n=1 Tax=Deinococcus cellulosilyticus (strain DSM 18568 / NBRC 106333 / KACC 11606 / 5516J-15) TaxID=1223518 RepID=A0A511MZI6_DEIC1|nr:ATP-binding protein [Deinococcus cellulosilyticus]GEM46025.1 hypothetical protein DC3_16600 [Deinococcus cellulosilyticus NBRC 106333 = KACC 11606]
MIDLKPFQSHFYQMLRFALPAISEHLGGLQEVPFLEAYQEELSSVGSTRVPYSQPIERLKDSLNLTEEELALLLLIGSVEEDVRFSALFEGLGGHPHPTVGLLEQWWQDYTLEPPRHLLERWIKLGVLRAVHQEGTRLQRSVCVQPELWEILRGNSGHLELYMPPAQLPALADLFLPEGFQVPPLKDLLVGGVRHSGRKTLLKALARHHQKGILTTHLTEGFHENAVLALVLDAVPLVVLPASPEPMVLPELPLDIPVFATCSVHQVVHTRAYRMALQTPGPAERKRIWKTATGREPETLHRRLPVGNLIRLGRGESLAVQALHPSVNRLPACGSYQDLALPEHVLQDLKLLETRCRFRERLGQHLPEVLTPPVGVKALFSGPSGTGKTLTARVLAGVLDMPLFRVDLSKVVSKFIGETEKNLDEVFEQAESQDVILLLDEGDALLTQRTAVGNANDRYANLETNYLLQRLEHYEGILLITTNASDRIDAAFQRRMDLTIDFPAPRAAERARIWTLHLPAAHALARDEIEHVAETCDLTGGQIRNVVLQATLLSLQDERPLAFRHLQVALRREYRKLGIHPPTGEP